MVGLFGLVCHGVHLTTRSQSVLGCSTAPSDVKGFTNAAMAWMPKSGPGRTVVSPITMAHLLVFA